MSVMDVLLNAVKTSIGSHVAQQSHTGFDPSALVNEIGGLFPDHQNQHGPGALPASQDPYGDPAGGRAATGVHGNIKPASQDPYGDPGNR